MNLIQEKDGFTGNLGNSNSEAKDIFWMLELTAPRIKSSIKSRHKQLELSESVLKKSNAIIENALSNEIYLYRSDFQNEFMKAGIKTDSNRLSHLLLCAELDGIICSGPANAGKQSYTLLSNRVPCKKILPRDLALAELAKRYFTSHGPATLKDFIWWSGLSKQDAKLGVESIKQLLTCEKVGSAEYWFASFPSQVIRKNDDVFLLPAYDEFLISYADRTPSLASSDNKKTVSNNGIFRPVVVKNGQVTGLWRRLTKKHNVIIEAEMYMPMLNKYQEQLQKGAYLYGQFLNRQIEINLIHPHYERKS